MPGEPAPIPLLLDTDIGDDVDDVFALLLAARQPRLELLGITTVYGDVAQRTRIARKLLRLAGRSGVPVVTGLGRTLAGRDPGPVIASGEGFATEAEPAGPGADEGAVDFLIERVLGHPTPPVLVAVGPLTNVGAALRREPRLAAHLKALIVMGGRLGAAAERGEHNLNSDPDATQLMLQSGARLRLGTFEVTQRARLGRPALERLRASGDAACTAAAAMLSRYLRHMSRDDTAMYDPLTLTLAYSEEFLRMRPALVSATYGEQLTALEAADAATSNTDVSVTTAAERFIEHLLTTITEGEHP